MNTELRPRITAVLDGERVLVLGHTSARGKARGLELDQSQMTVALVFQVRDSKVIRHVLYLSRADALAELGLEE